MLHLHLGVDENDVTSVSARANENGQKVFVDGDGWQAWGEKPNVKGNEGPLRHVIIEVSSKAEAVNTVEEERKFIPTMPATLSDKDVWSTYKGAGAFPI